MRGAFEALENHGFNYGGETMLQNWVDAVWWSLMVFLKILEINIKRVEHNLFFSKSDKPKILFELNVIK